MAFCFAGMLPPLPFYASPACVRVFKFGEHITMSGFLDSFLGKFQGKFLSPFIEEACFSAERPFWGPGGPWAALGRLIWAQVPLVGPTGWAASISCAQTP